MEIRNSGFVENNNILIMFLLLIILAFISAFPVQSKPVFEDFNAENFTQSTSINNEWLPLKPGMQWIFEGTTIEDGKTFFHRIEFTVTDLTKKIAGVQTVVVLLTDFSNNELVEQEIAFYAQDNDGNVWFFGEYPEEYEGGKFVKAPAWVAGLEGAKAGIKMRAKPQAQEPSYFQGWGPAVKWSDFGQIEKLDEKTCVPTGCYEDLLLIAESSLGEENAFQLKYYARGVGNVRVGWRGDDETHEELKLVKSGMTDPQTHEKVTREAIRLERRAYRISPKLYGLSLPMSDRTGKTIEQVSTDTKNVEESKVAQIRKISEDEAVKIAVKAVPGKVTDVDIEKKLGANRYVVEVIADKDGEETDIIIEMESGKVLLIEK